VPGRNRYRYIIQFIAKVFAECQLKDPQFILFQIGSADISLESSEPKLSLFDMASAANNQENDGGVKVLMQKDETKNKSEKKIAETEIETKTSELFSDFQPVLASEQEDVAVIPSPGNWGRTKVKYRQLRRELKKETVFRP